jgi:L-threonylcarbamoyladenylate synthase
MSQVITLKKGHLLGRSNLDQLAHALKQGAVAIFPTETVYGVGTNVFSAQGIKRIYQLKGRSWRKPLSLLVPELAWAAPLVATIPPEAFRLAKELMPGPITLIFKASELGRLTMGGIETVGVRIPDHPIALAILKAVGVPLATTSVNRSGQEPATTGRACHELFGDKVDWLIDNGACRIKEPSSIVDLSHYPFTILREGAISKKKLEKILDRS